MPVELLTLLKFALLALLYLFLFRTVQVVAADLRGPRRQPAAPPRPTAAPPAEAPRRSRRHPRELVLHPPTGSPRVVPLSGRGVVLGRSRNVAVVVDDVYVSDEHTEVLPDAGGWSVRDLGSTNGTFLNGTKVTRPTPLAAGDRLRIGKTTIEVRR